MVKTVGYVKGIAHGLSTTFRRKVAVLNIAGISFLEP